ncbi:MAG TPA: histidine phosphatase family protein [Rhodanobacteraceae bacterium]|nr:histidine phosphatase family protein [Rhodanobacteraceae bacterium]
MRELLLLRHAEALSAGPDTRDVDRRLSPHGEAQARAAGTWLAGRLVAPDVVLCSPARRARMTLDGVGESLPMPAPRFLDAIYDATPGDLLTMLEAHAADADRTLLVGHNPGLEQLLALLTEGRSAQARGLSPATLAWIEFADDALEPGQGRLHALWSP